MRLTDLTPNDYWQTDLIDLELGKAVQDAWREGAEAARQSHQAEQQAQEQRAARIDQYRGQAQC